MRCPQCAKDVPEESRFCLSCGAALASSGAPTLVLHAERQAPAPDQSGDQDRKTPSEVARFSSEAVEEARFVPGARLAGRYRIVGLLGRGGMGEVYRADDLKLGQPVALKFLPASLAYDGAALARFHREVRIARQVSHPNVCRVFDIGDVDGLHFLSMEYVDGEDLASLLRRIGRLPADKALEIARQLCAGLAAAHDAGVLHRDLKPANVMLDGRGKARVTDFGLAGLAADFRDRDVREGTPAYMAPEQLAGREVTVRSDLYALGLVLYEVFTGKRAFAAAPVQELLRQREQATPPTPSSLVKEIDPLVERVILRCLETEPQKRPASALHVAAALPGGDPLQAALAAGETPSPEMVAAAPIEGVLRPGVAAALFGSVMLLLGLLLLLAKQATLYNQVPLHKPPAVLQERASEITKRLGYPGAPADSAYGFVIDEDYLRYVRAQDSSSRRWDRLAAGQPAAIRFWYRQSPHPLVPFNGLTVTTDDPPSALSGMVLLNLDTEGRLLDYEAVPPQVDEAQGAHPAPDWSVLFNAAGLEYASSQATESMWTPPHAYDTRMAWNGVYPNWPEMPIRIEAAAYRGKPTYFAIVSPWRRAAQQVPYQASGREKAGIVLLLVLFFGTLSFSALLALRHLRLGRGDRKGAFRLTLFVFAASMIRWAFTTHHVPSGGEVMLVVTGLESALFWSGFVGVMYLALEPYLRQRWPEQIIAWSRLLAGDFRDPLIGRDILFGAVFGLTLVLMWNLGRVLPTWFGWPPRTPWYEDSIPLLGTRSFLPSLMAQIGAALESTFIIVFLLLFLTMLLRRNWLGIGASWVVLATLMVLALGIENLTIGVPLAALSVSVIVFFTMRYGVVVALSAFFFLQLWTFFPATPHLSAWYAGDFVLDLIVLVALAGYGFRTSLAGQPVFRGELLQDRLG